MTAKRLIVCAVRDSAMMAFAPPMAFIAMGQAQRSFRDEANRKDSAIYAHPEDYELWMLGWFDEDSGRLEPVNPECVCRAKDVKESLQ